MTTAVILIVLVLLVAAALAAFLVNRRKQEREALRERFGPEYDRAVEERGDRREAEHHLSDVAVAPGQGRDPRAAAGGAGALLVPVDRRPGRLRGRPGHARPGTPTTWSARSCGTVATRWTTWRTAADLVATDHAELAGHYRAAHEVGRRADNAETEELRQAFVHYRALFVELLAEPSGRHDGHPRAPRPST